MLSKIQPIYKAICFRLLFAVLFVSVASVNLGIKGCANSKNNPGTITGNSGQTNEVKFTELMKAPPEPGRLLFESTGKEFVLDNNPISSNFKITSSEEIRIVIRAITNTVSFHIEPLSTTSKTETTITIWGLEDFYPESNTSFTLFRYQDGHFLEEFTITDGSEYTYTQDISQKHHIYILPVKATIHLYGNPGDVIYLRDFGPEINDFIVIDSDGIIVDGIDTVVNGPGFGYGIEIAYRTGVTIRNCTVQNFNTGISLDYSNNITLTNNTTLLNYYGIYLFDSYENTLTNNTAYENRIFLPPPYNTGTGISLESSSNNNFVNNNTSSNDFGLVIGWYSNWNNLTDCTANSNYAGINLYYQSNNNRLQGITAESNEYGVAIEEYSNNNTLTNSTTISTTISFNYVGLYLSHSFNSKVYHNNIYSNWGLNVYSEESIELSYYNPETQRNEGNWWGHTSPPGFIMGIDSNQYNSHHMYVVVRDSYPYLVKDGWLLGYAPGQPEDTTPPVGSVSINTGALATPSINVTLSLWAEDSETGVSLMRFSNDSIIWTDWESYATTKQWMLIEGDGIKTVYVEYQNSVHLTSRFSDTIILDTIPPVIQANIIPAPNTYGWNNTDVIVSFEATDEGSGIAYITYPTILTAEGIHEIIGTAIDNAGNSTSTTVTVRIDKTPPIISYTQEPLPNEYGWNNTPVIVTFNASDAFSGIATVTPPQLIATEGVGQQVIGIALDKADNSVSTTAILNIDMSPPTGFIYINNDAETTSSTLVTLTLFSEDNLSTVSTMRFSNDSIIWSDWESYATTKEWILTEGDGEKTVYVKYKNEADLVARFSDTINLLTQIIHNALTDFVATAVSSSQIDLFWTDVIGETGYKIERYTGWDGTYEQIATVNANIISYSDTSLSPTTFYSYRIRGYSQVGDSDYSNEAFAMTFVTIEDIINLVNQYYQNGLIKNYGIYNSLLAKLNAANESLQRGEINTAINQLNALINEIEAQKGKGIEEQSAQNLLTYTQYLIHYLTPEKIASGQHLVAMFSPVDWNAVEIRVVETPTPYQPMYFLDENASVGEMTQGILTLLYADIDRKPVKVERIININNITKEILYEGTPVTMLRGIFTTLPSPLGEGTVTLLLDFSNPVSISIYPVFGCTPRPPVYSTDKDREIVTRDNSGRLPVTEEQVRLNLESIGLTPTGPTAVITQTGVVTNTYNCHGWTFTCGEKWVNPDQVPKILEDNGYKECNPKRRPQVGDIAVYKDAQGNIVHTGIITAVVNGNVTEIESKWADGGKYKHAPDKVLPWFSPPPKYHYTERAGTGPGKDRHTLKKCGYLGIEPVIIIFIILLIKKWNKKGYRKSRFFKTYIKVIPGCLCLLFLFSCETAPDDSIWELEKKGIIEKMKEILDKADSEIARKVNETILDKVNTDVFYAWSWGSSESGYNFFIRTLLSKEEVQFLIEKSDISIPLMLERLSSKKGVDYVSLSRPLAVYFLVFGEKKSTESIPFLVDFLKSLPESREKILPAQGEALACAVDAIKKITDGKVSTVQIMDIKSLFDQHYKIADQTKTWYKEHKRN